MTPKNYLCFYNVYWRGDFVDQTAVMVSAYNVGDVVLEFNRAMTKVLQNWGCYSVGPFPRHYKLIGWISESGEISNGRNQDGSAAVIESHH